MEINGEPWEEKVNPKDQEGTPGKDGLALTEEQPASIELKAVNSSWQEGHQKGSDALVSK